MTALLEIEGLRVDLGGDKSPVHVLRGVDLSLTEGEATGLVGESGSGKSTTLLAIVGLLPRSARVLSGSVRFQGRELLRLSDRELRDVRGREISFIFQNARAALYPLMPVGKQLARVYRRHHKSSQASARAETIELLASVGLPDVERLGERFPHELSGGQCQRVMIAMALIARPKLILADEPTSGLDVTVQHRVLETLVERVRDFGVTMLLVSHDISVVSRTCERVAVMYAGEVVESGARELVLRRPAHPYTDGLLAALKLDGDRMHSIPGQVPDLRVPLTGCPFVGRCPKAHEACVDGRPELIRLPEGQEVRCTLYGRAGRPRALEASRSAC